MANILKEFPYLYETHMHTQEASRCGKVSGAEMARLAKEYGYAGVFITDHHWGGNTRVDRQLPWEDWVDGVEMINAQHSNPSGNRPHPEYDRQAKEYAAKYGLPGTAGSDMHVSTLLGGGVAFREKLNSVQDFIRQIKSGEDYVITDGVHWYDPWGTRIDADD